MGNIWKTVFGLFIIHLLVLWISKTVEFLSCSRVLFNLVKLNQISIFTVAKDKDKI